MKIMKEISDMIEDEIEGACEYAKRAVELKEEMPDFADTLYSISLQEVKRKNCLGQMVSTASVSISASLKNRQ